MRGGKREGAGRKPGSKKTGARNAVIKTRLTDRERAAAILCAETIGESESEYLRNALAMRCGLVQGGVVAGPPDWRVFEVPGPGDILWVESPYPGEAGAFPASEVLAAITSGRLVEYFREHY